MSHLSTGLRCPQRGADLHAAVAGILAKPWFFIGAFPKSGTTWLQVSLDAHPDILCRGEAHLTSFLAPGIDSLVQNHNKLIDLKNTSIFNEFDPFPQFAPEDRDHMVRSALALLMLRSGNADRARLIGEKTPDNAQAFPRLQALFPAARFVHMLRDGRDCAVSLWFHNLRAGGDSPGAKYDSLDAYAIATAPEWRRRVARGLAFAAAEPGRCLNIRYEDMLATPGAALAGVLRFIGASDAPGEVAACLEAGDFQRMSGGRRPGQEDRASFMRKARPGDWREHLSPAANRAFVAEAGDVLAALGYAC